MQIMLNSRSWTLSSQGRRFNEIMLTNFVSRNLFPFMLSYACLISFGVAHQPDSNDRLAIVGGTLWDGTGSPPLTNAALLISQGRIIAVGPREQITIPNNTRIIHAEGKWLVPGLIDSHVHFSQSGGLYTRPDVIDLRDQRSYQQEQNWIKERMPYTMSRYMCSGVTSVVDVGGPLWTLLLKRQFQNKDAPHIAATGPLLSTYVPSELNISDPPIIALGTEQQARVSVKNLLQRGANLIKIWFLKKGITPQSLKSIKAVINQAHSQNSRVVVHATELALARLAVEAGADILAHSVVDEPVDANFLELLKQKNVIYIPTLQVREGYHKVLQKRPHINAIEEACGDPEVIATWDDLFEVQDISFLEDPNIAKENLRRVARSGIKIAAGSDAGNIGTLHGPALHRELELMVQAGLSPRQALLAATRDAALVLSKTPEVGTLKPGKLADILILRDNPLVDIRNLSKIHRVISLGKSRHIKTGRTP